MKRENIEIGIKVVPHSKSYCGDLENSVNWNYAKMINQPYLFVSRIHNDYIVLDTIKGSNNGDFFLPEDFEPYIEETKTNLENNNEGRNIKMEKFDLNSSMLFKMRDEKLYALLPDHENDLVFYDVEDINAGYTEGTVFFNDTATTEIYTLSLHDALPIYVSFLNELKSLRNLTFLMIITSLIIESTLTIENN